VIRERVGVHFLTCHFYTTPSFGLCQTSQTIIPNLDGIGSSSCLSFRSLSEKTFLVVKRVSSKHDEKTLYEQCSKIEFQTFLIKTNIDVSLTHLIHMFLV